MFHDLKDAWKEMLAYCVHTVDQNGIHVSFPEKVFYNFEQEFNICFVEPEEDVSFQNWLSPYNGE